MNDTPKRRWYQFSLMALFILITLAAIGTGTVWRLWPWWQEQTLVRNLRKRVLAAQDSRGAGEALIELLKPEKPGRLQSLSNDSDTSIALKASFELVADRRGRVKLSPENQLTFLRTLKERTKLQPPDWWSKRLLEEYPSQDQSLLHYAGKVDYKEEVGLFLDERKLVIPNSGFTRIAKTFNGYGRGNYLAIIDSPHSYFARCDDYGSRFNLFCIDSATGKVVWSAEVWSGGLDNLGGGISGVWLPHDAQLEMNDGLIVVWGGGTTATYVEAFGRTNGQNQIRFSTDTWCIR